MRWIVGALGCGACFPGPLPLDDVDGAGEAGDATAVVETDGSATGVETSADGVEVEVDAAECGGDGDCDRLDGLCVEGRCDAGRCVSEPQTGGSCDDGDKCTTGDACEAGTCRGAAVVCAAIDECHQAGACNPDTGTCTTPTKDNGSACDDGDACTHSDDCSNGTCSGTSVVCDLGPCDESTACVAIEGCVAVPRTLDSACLLTSGEGGFCRGRDCGDKRLSLGDEHTCLVLPDSRLRCWGSGGGGVLGTGNQARIGDDEHPADAELSLGGRQIKEVAASGFTTCALSPEGQVTCFGDGSLGQLGYGPTLSVYGQVEIPSRTVSLSRPAIHIASGGTHVCVLLDNGRVQCWGAGAWGKLGYGNSYQVSDPAEAGLVEVGESAKAISAGPLTTCVLTVAGAVRCWGFNRDGQLGLGHTEDVGDDELPMEANAVELDMPQTAIAMSAKTTCALDVVGGVTCWGGSPGYGSSDRIGDDELPGASGYVEIPEPVRQIAAGSDMICAVSEGDRLFCWGTGSYGGSGVAKTGVLVPTELDLSSPVRSVFVGGWHACAVDVTGAIRCWGSNFGGELGYPGRALGEHLGDEDGEMPPGAVLVDLDP
ncbi:MAG: hypothetical protein IT385_08775 [Deltaproteobacteria bacterium]|nr:hypothetical protein [Deltaproteobacteria bacterium]